MWLPEIYEHIMTLTVTPSVLPERSEVQFKQTPSIAETPIIVRVVGGGKIE
jgi:hypothetical protein